MTAATPSPDAPPPTGAVIYLGSGGVGKTTVAAATALAAADAGRRVAVLTIDPARRLADTLGLDDDQPTDDGLHLVQGPWPGRLWAGQLDPTATLTAVLAREGGPGQAERVMANPTFQALTRSAPGFSEYMAVERLHQLCHDDRFDLVVVDTPPSRHAVDFLDSPHRLVGFLDNRLYRTVLAPRAGVLRSVNTAAQLALRTVSRMVGMELVDNVIGLFADLEGLDRGFQRRAAEMAGLLHSDRCHYRLVTAARPDPIAEARWLGRRLGERDLAVDTVVVNRLTPFGRGPAATVGRGPGRGPLQENLDQLRTLAGQEEILLEALLDDLGRPPVTRIEEQAAAPRGRDLLLTLGHQLPPAPTGTGPHGTTGAGADGGPTTPVRPRARPRPLRSTR